MADNLDDIWKKMDNGDIDHQEPECEWNESQTKAVQRFKALFNIDHPAHDYFRSKDQDCMILRFTRTPRKRHDSQFYYVNMSINESKGIYLLLDGEKFSKKLTQDQRDAIIQLYNSITNSTSEN